MSPIQLPPQQYVASFDVDAQNCFTPLCPEELPVPEGAQIVDELNAQARFAALRIGSKDAHSPQAIWVASTAHPALSKLQSKHADTYWPVHAVPGTFGFALLKGLPHPADYDFFVWKGVEPDMHPYGACYHDLAEQQSSGVIEYLRAHAIQTVIVGGLATDYCVKSTVLQLRRAGFAVLLNLAACRGIAAESSAAALQVMQAQGVVLAENAQALIRLSADE
jgi:nicotinamidase/pyrazinamidase